MTQTDYPTYFYKCNVCDSNDHGAVFYDYEIVDCPACGSKNMTRWEAKPNMNRTWAYCAAFGHSWKLNPGSTTAETCECCLDTRDLTPPSAKIR